MYVITGWTGTEIRFHGLLVSPSAFWLISAAAASIVFSSTFRGVSAFYWGANMHSHQNQRRFHSPLSRRNTPGSETQAQCQEAEIKGLVFPPRPPPASHLHLASDGSLQIPPWFSLLTSAAPTLLVFFASRSLLVPTRGTDGVELGGGWRSVSPLVNKGGRASLCVACQSVFEGF